MNLKNLLEKLNESRTKKLAEYNRMKVEIANRKKEILQSLEAEERELINKIDAEIMIEKGLDKLMIHVFIVV